MVHGHATSTQTGLFSSATGDRRGVREEFAMSRDSRDLPASSLLPPFIASVAVKTRNEICSDISNSLVVLSSTQWNETCHYFLRVAISGPAWERSSGSLWLLSLHMGDDLSHHPSSISFVCGITARAEPVDHGSSIVYPLQVIGRVRSTSSGRRLEPG